MSDCHEIMGCIVVKIFDARLVRGCAGSAQLFLHVTPQKQN